MEIFFALMEIFKWVSGSPAASGQPRKRANDIAVVLLVAPGRHQWPHNQLFASTAITYQLAEWLSGLSIGPSGLSCLSVPGCDKKVWGKEENAGCSVLHLGAKTSKPGSKKRQTLGRRLALL